MIIENVNRADTGELINIGIRGDKITNVSSTGVRGQEDELRLKFDRAIVFPGLINSHDHIDFNLFPRLGNKIYANYTEWGKHIHDAYKDDINEVLKIPVPLRVQWGVYKNLLCGVTTVVNHGEKLKIEDELITVFEDTHCLHSVQFEKGWKIKLNNPFKAKLPVNIHVGEGDDFTSSNEIDQLTGWNLFRKKLIGVHAVAMSEGQAKKFEAVVWCPQSNYFLLDKTAKVNLLKKHTTLLFGTDSTLTSSWDMWDHLQSARQTMLVSDSTLYQSLNENAAKTWRLHTGEIAAGKDADLVVAKAKNNASGLNAFFATGPADLLLVVHKGHIRLFDESVMHQLQSVDLSDFSKIYVYGACKYVQGDLPGLIEKIKGYYSKADFHIDTRETA